ncbi:hypothetical protein FEO88_04240 [Stenotrophomonas maltophilia]|nr:hypothetical protein FEO88_04240 [Stenotrophomonas maltophilia]
MRLHPMQRVSFIEK